MIPHPFKPDPHGRDVCDQKLDEDGQIRLCGQRRGEHMDEVHGLKIQLATALRERDEALAMQRAQMAAVLHTIGGTVEGYPTGAHNYLQRLRALVAEKWKCSLCGVSGPKTLEAMNEHLLSCVQRPPTAESDRDSLRTVLTEVNDLLTTVPEGEDWRQVVRKKVVVALFGEAAWTET